MSFFISLNKELSAHNNWNNLSEWTKPIFAI